MKRKTNIDQKEETERKLKEAAQGNKKLTSKSKIMNKIATK